VVAAAVSRNLTPEEALTILTESVRSIEPEPVWSKVIQSYLLPSLGTPAPNLVLTLVGPSNSGKSLIFNSVPYLHNHLHEPPGIRVQDPSTVSFDAQSTARPLLMFSDSLFDEKGTFDARFPRSERWKSRDQTTQPGPPLVYFVNDFYRNLILVDTPAFNWPASRGEVTGLMRASDVLVYVFSNANYDDEENLAFMRDWLLENGPRDVIFVYNVNAAIPEEVIGRHFIWLMEKVFQVESSVDFPSNLIGVYQMVHSEKTARGETLGQFISHHGSQPLDELLAGMDKNAATHRRQLLNLTLGHVLAAVEQTVDDSDRENAELELAGQLFAKYLDYLVGESLKSFPFYRLSQELEVTWNRQASGVRGFAHWVAHPLRMSGFSRSLSVPQVSAMTEMERHLETVVEQIAAKFRLAVAERRIRVPVGEPMAEQSAELVREFRERFPDKRAQDPAVNRKDGHYVIQLPTSAPVEKYFENYLRRDWPAVVASASKDAKENFSDLTMRIQTRLDEIARNQGLAVRGVQAAFVTMAVLPAIIAVAYMAYRGTGLTDLQTLSTIFGAHLAARLFVALDQNSIRKSWNQAVHEWFLERQEPRLTEILQRNIGVKPAATSTVVNRDEVRSAIETLRVLGL
jgi:hypothetical protein